MSDMDSMVLRRWVAHRDPEAFRELASRHAGMVYSTCRRILGNATDAEDVAQECFETLAQITNASAVRSLGAWLHGVATKRSLQRLRSEQRRVAREADYSDSVATYTAPEWNEIHRILDETISELPERLRTVMVMHFLEDRSHADIARDLGIPRQTVTYRIGRGVEAVRGALERRGVSSTLAGLTAGLVAARAEAAPATLAAALGRVALSGSFLQPATAALIQHVAISGGLLAVKKSIVAVVVAIVAIAVVGGVYIAQRAPTAEAPPPPPPSPASAHIASERDMKQSSKAAPADGTTSTDAARPTLNAPAASVPAVASTMTIMEGRLVDTARHALAGWYVCAAEIGAKLGYEDPVVGEIATDSEGRFMLELPKGGTYRLFAVLSRSMHDPFVPIADQQPRITLADGEHRRDYTLVYDDGRTISGRVVDVGGLPVEGVQLWAYPHVRVDDPPDDFLGGTGLARTGADGTFRLQRLGDSTHRVHASAEGYEDQSVHEVMIGTDDLQIVLKPAAIQFSGRVTTASSGQPIPNFEVAFLPGVTEPSAFSPSANDFTSYTVADGRFSATTAALGGNLSVIVRAAGYAQTSKTFSAVQAGATVEAAWVMEAGRLVRGRVLDSHGSPVSGADVYVGWPPNSDHPAGYLGVPRDRSGDDGTYAIDTIAPQDQRLSAAIRGYVPGVALIPIGTGSGAIDLDIVLPDEGGSIVGVVTDGGQPLPDAELQMYGGDTGAFNMTYYARTDAEGKYGFSRLPEIPFDLQCVYPMTDPETGDRVQLWTKQELEVSDGQTVVVNMSILTGDAIVEGTVRVNGEIVAGANVRIAYDDGDGSGRIFRVGGHNDGTFRFVGLTPGEAKLQVNFPTQWGQPEWSEPLVVGPAGVTLLNVDISQP